MIGELPAIDPEIITTLSGSSRTGNSMSTLSGSYGSLLGAISWATSAGFSSETTAYVFSLTGSCSCSCGMLSASCYFYGAFSTFGGGGGWVVFFVGEPGGVGILGYVPGQYIGMAVTAGDRNGVIIMSGL